MHCKFSAACGPCWKTLSGICLSLFLFTAHSPLPAAEPVPVAEITDFKDWITDLCWTPNGRVLICGSYERVLIWSVERKETIRTFDHVTGSATSLVVLPARRQLLIGSYQRIMHIDTTTWTPQREFRGHRSQITALVVVDDNRFLSAADDGLMKLFDLQGRILEEFNFKEPVTSLVYCPNRSLIAVSLGDETRVSRPGKLVLFDLPDWKPIEQQELHRSAATAVLFSADKRSVLTASFDETVIVTEIHLDTKRFPQTGIFRDHSRPVNCLASVPGTDLIVSGSGGRFKGKNELKLWKQSTGNVLVTLEPHEERISCVAVSPDGKLLATGGHDKKVLLWNLADWPR